MSAFNIFLKNHIWESSFGTHNVGKALPFLLLNLIQEGVIIPNEDMDSMGDLSLSTTRGPMDLQQVVVTGHFKCIYSFLYISIQSNGYCSIEKQWQNKCTKDTNYDIQWLSISPSQQVWV